MVPFERPGLEVLRCGIPVRHASLVGEFARPTDAQALVVFAHGSGSSRLSPRNRRVAATLQQHGLATLLFDLLTEGEDRQRDRRFDVPFLTTRLIAAVNWAMRREGMPHLPVGLFGASTGAAAAIETAAEIPEAVGAVVSRGGRPDLAPLSLPRVKAPTLLLVGSRDEDVLHLNEWALDRLKCERRLVVVPGATHLFEEQGALERVAEEAAVWFQSHLLHEPAAPGAAKGGSRG